MKIMPLASTTRGLPRSPWPAPRGRRGALLLLVLSMLTLFMMIGTLMLVLAMRARSTSRAFADAAAGSGNRAAARGLLDEALMRLVRGVPPPAGGALPARESLLADRYGVDTRTGMLTAITAAGPVLTATVTGINAATPLELVGRILTINPKASDSAPVTSFRILSKTGNTYTLANLRTVGVRQLPAADKLPCDVFVNGREFAGASGHESADAFDAANLFLTQATPNGATVTINRPAYGALPAKVDNDGDSVADGIWLDDFLPEQPDGSKVRVSFLVLDLGGRLNVNAHGTSAADPGSGPAAVNGSPLFSDPAAWTRLLGGGTSPAAPQAPGAGNRRPAPALGSGLQGRFGGGPADTYALRLDFDGPRMASRTATGGNVFTCGELEWVLRPFDDDTASLPPRLAALLGDSAEPARMLVTTDSWDTCGMVGEAARKRDAYSGAATLPDEAKEGIRFNLDRPLTTQSQKQKFFEDFVAVVVAAGAPAAKAAQWCANVVEFIDNDVPATPPEPFTMPAGIAGGAVTGVEPGALPQAIRDLLPVKDPGSFESPAVLLAVPTGTKEEIEQKLAPPQPIKSLVIDHPEILDAVTVASPFRSTVFVEAGGRTLCRWREPGRINVNTCDDKVWKALTGANLTNPFKAGPPAQSLSDLLLRLPQVIASPDRDVRSLNLNLAHRLANIATTRSDVFAVWVTLEVKQSATDRPPEYYRLFAIVDRSIPVGHAAGQNLNARDTFRVLRHLE